MVTIDDTLAYCADVTVCPDNSVHACFCCNDATKANALKPLLEGISCDKAPQGKAQKGANQLTAADKTALKVANVPDATVARMEKATINWGSLLALIQKDGPAALAIIEDVLHAFGL